jgi:hypothetical protein
VSEEVARLKLWVALLLWFFASSAAAHKPSDSYLSLMTDGPRVAGQWDIALRDLDFALGLDVDGDGRLTWGEVRSRHQEIAAYALARLHLQADGRDCTTRPTAHLVDEHSDGGYAVLRFDTDCSGSPARLDVGYSLFFDLDAQHKGLVSVRGADGTRAYVLGADSRELRAELRESSWAEALSGHVREGIWHIWIGFDHILFLLSLLLPAVLARRNDRWEPAETFRGALLDVMKVVTAFTVAHSVTLSAAALGAVELPTRWVESAIAASVVVAALNNVWPVLPLRRWTMAFGFGLIHGFGFAAVLADLGLPREALALSLVGFNVGVEAGQLAIVAAFLPLAWLLRHRWVYRRLIFAAGSLAVAALAATWFVERAFDLRLIG